MSQGDFLERLFQSKATEWRELGAVGTFQRGKRFVKTDMVSEGVPCIHYGEMYTKYGVWANQSFSFIDKTLAARLRVANPNDVIIVAAGETIGDIGDGTAWLGDEDVIIHDACFSFKSNLHPKYVSYYLRTKLFKKQIKKYISSGKISAINSSGLGKAKIPIPCPDEPEKSYAIQTEIARVLDSFTELETELETELGTRKKQYAYYRDRLLTFDDTKEVRWTALSELGELVRGNGLQKKDFTDTGVPAIHYGQIYTHYGFATHETKSFVSRELAQNLKKVDKGDVVITNTSENISDVGKALVYLGDTQAVTGGHATVFKPNRLMTDGKYFAYFTQTDTFATAKRKRAKGTKVIDVSATDMAKIEIPIPYPDDPEKSLIEQARIVNILDKFNTLTNSISEGLPREIELRRKQYEYYRDTLYSFPMSDGAEAA